MSEIVEGVDTPFVTNMSMMMESDSIYDRISESSVGMLVINLSSQRKGALLMQT